MFGLTPRSHKIAAMLPKAQETKEPSGLEEEPVSDELRLAHALQEVLAKKPTTHHHSRDDQGVASLANRVEQADQKPFRGPPAPRSKKTRDVGLLDRDGAGFFWVATDTAQNEVQSTSKVSKRWLKRAQRENRWANLRRCAQWILLTCAACAVIMLTIWPSAS